jgi:hypothetical protein
VMKRQVDEFTRTLNPLSRKLRSTPGSWTNIDGPCRKTTTRCVSGRLEKG